MKKLLIAAAGVALISSPAAAESWGNQSYGQDAVAVWGLNAPVTNFCRLNANGGTQSDRVGATFTAGSFGGGGSAAEADGQWNLDIQDAATNTVKLSGGAVTYSNSQCNTPFQITARSERGGLYNGKQFEAGSAFINNVDYRVDVKFGSGSTAVQTITGGAPQTVNLISNQLATSGDFRIGIVVPANPNALLLQGSYTDRLTVTMTPTIS